MMKKLLENVEKYINKHNLREMTGNGNEDESDKHI